MPNIRLRTIHFTGMAMVPEGLDMAVRLMTPGEVSTVRSAPGYAYDGRADRPEVSAP